MAGQGSRFSEAGYKEPKPLIPIHGIPMIKVVIDNLSPQIQHRFTFICRSDHLLRYDLERMLTDWSPGCNVISTDHLTQGAACTVLLAKDIINNDDPLMIANCDQYIDASIDEYLNTMEATALDGIIMTMTANDLKWSFVRLDENDIVLEVAEKQVISNEATVGIYNYRTGKLFVDAAEAMIESGLRVNGEFYVAPTYNMLISNNCRIGIYNIGSNQSGMYGLGVPEDLDYFLGITSQGIDKRGQPTISR